MLPVGISFYTFQTLGTTIDIYRGRLPACRSALSYFTYVAFFPQLVAGPIERGGRLLPQFASSRRFDAKRAADGLRLMLWGLVQKVALADNLAALVDGCYDGSCSGPVLGVNTVAFAFQIYWDFAGYSNIAVGCAALFGFSLSRNFASPYFSRSVAEFWRRWHITLSTWFRDYVYVSLGGNRRGRVRQAINVMITFGVSGLWHGASWNFVVWGLFNGALAVPGIVAGSSRSGPDEVPGGQRAWPGFRDGLAMVRTFALICVGWVFFRAPDLQEAWAIVLRIATDVWSPSQWAALAAVDGQLRAIGSLLAIGVVVEWLQRRQPHALVLSAWPRWARWSLYTLLVWSTLYLTRDDPTRFIYFQF